MQVLDEIKKASNRELSRWLAECERRHPEFINTEASIKDEMRRRELATAMKPTSVMARRPSR